MSKKRGKTAAKYAAKQMTRRARSLDRMSAQRQAERLRLEQRRRVRRMIFIVGGLVGALVLVVALAQSITPARGGSTGSTVSAAGLPTTTAAAATTTPAATPTPSQVSVTVTLQDGKLSSTLTSFQTGVRYDFVIHNAGHAAQDFALLPPPVRGASRAQADLTALVTMSAVQPGATASFEYQFQTSFAAGQLEFATAADRYAAFTLSLPITVTTA